MDKNTATRAIEWLLNHSDRTKKISINFFGGEPLMNFQLVKFVVHYLEKKSKEYEKKVRYGITTNATLLNNYNIKFLKKFKIKPLVSFDGPQKIQDNNRPFRNGEGSYQEVFRNIKKLLQKIPKSGCRATITQTDSINDIKQEIMTAGFTHYSLSYANPSLLGNYPMGIMPQAQLQSDMLEFLENEASETLKWIKKRKISNQGFRILLRRLKNLILKSKHHYGCKAGKKYLAISINGDIFPCHRFIGIEKMKLGTVWEGTIDRKTYQRGVVSNIEKCKDCWARFFCGGGCMYLNMSTKGEIYLPDNAFCEEVKLSIEIAISLFHQLDDSDISYLKNEFSALYDSPINNQSYSSL